ncbi:DUF6978 family protein [Candidatus Methanoperedens nitratireducens]|nr:hypothetical protein [Candidatus Methanoperedens nitroreducens]
MVSEKMLTQDEANILIGLPKVKKYDDIYAFPSPGDTLMVPVISQNGLENFLIDINRGRIQITKCTYQERHQERTILLRLDIDGPPHHNPYVETLPLPDLEPYNGRIIPCPHVHLYVEGFMDKWAIPAPTDKFPNTIDLFKTIEDFLDYCNVIDKPKFWRESLNGF